jgi:hypothetical protein
MTLHIHSLDSSNIIRLFHLPPSFPLQFNPLQNNLKPIKPPELSNFPLDIHSRRHFPWDKAKGNEKKIILRSKSEVNKSRDGRFSSALTTLEMEGIQEMGENILISFATLF